MRNNKCFSPALAILLTAALSYAAQDMLVQVKTGQLRDAPSFLGKIVAPLSYGEKVTMVQQKGDWMKVTSSHGVAGWVHGSALTAKRVKMTAGSQDAKVAASGDEMALAGKGFNKDVEADFKSKNKDIDYAWVDSMGGMVITPQETARFVNEGGLRPLP
jgi:uncharacterized protein YgiM (DUF1202 family)